MSSGYLAAAEIRRGIRRTGEPVRNSLEYLMLLGCGSRLWGEGLEGLERQFDEVRLRSAPSGTTHVEFERA